MLRVRPPIPTALKVETYPEEEFQQLVTPDNRNPA